MGESVISCSIYTYFYTNCLSTNNRKFSPIIKRKTVSLKKRNSCNKTPLNKQKLHIESTEPEEKLR